MNDMQFVFDGDEVVWLSDKQPNHPGVVIQVSDDVRTRYIAARSAWMEMQEELWKRYGADFRISEQDDD